MASEKVTKRGQRIDYFREYTDKNYDKCVITCPKGTRMHYQKIARARGFSGVSEYFRRLVESDAATFVRRTETHGSTEESDTVKDSLAAIRGIEEDREAEKQQNRQSFHQKMSQVMSGRKKKAKDTTEGPES